MKKSVRASRAPLYVALSVFMAMAVALVILLAGRSKAFALEIPDGYALGIEALTSEGSGITPKDSGSKIYQIDGAQGFVTLARVSQSDSLEGYTFQIATRDVINLTTYDTENSVLTDTGFYGIGSEAVPFRGKIVYVKGVTDDTAIHMTGWKVLFNNLSTKASIISEEGVDGKKLVAHLDGAFSLCDTLTLEDGNLDISGFLFAAKSGDSGIVQTDRSAGLVAAKVKAGTGGVDLRYSLLTGNAYELQTANGTVGGLFGTVESGATLNVTLPEDLNLTATTTVGHAGALVGENKGSLTVSGLAKLAATATAGDSYAAGLVGVNSGKIDFANAITVSDITATGTTVGGVVGENKLNAEVKLSGNVTLTQGNATGNIVGGVAGVSEGGITVAAGKTCTVTGATLTATGVNPVMGGFVGQLTAQAETNIENVSVAKAEFVGTGTDTAHTVGGYFGLLTANGQVNFSATATSNFTFSFVKSGDVGGIIGKVAGNSAVTVGGTTNASLTVNNTFRNNDFNGILGGAVGTVGSGAYLKTANLSVTNTMEKMTEGMADLVGVVADGALADVSELTYGNTDKDSVLVSETGAGSVLRLSGKVADISAKSGHIVRTQNNSLLYAENVLYTSKNDPTANDVGNYGQILRNEKIGGIITLDGVNRTVTLSGKLDKDSITLSNAADAAKLAVTLQTHGVFSGVEGIDRNNYNDLLTNKKTITFGADIDLRSTGVEQFTCAAEEAPFTGTIDGGGHTLTLAIGETIRKKNTTDSTQNVGILKDGVNARAYMGAFSALSDATVENLTVGGMVSYAGNVQNGDSIRIGGLAGYAENAVAIEGCTTDLAVTLNGQNGAVQNKVYVGGLIGRAENAALTVKNSTVAANISHNSGYGGDSVWLGGAIGEASDNTGADKEINFTGNTIQAKVNQAVQATNAHVGGFIADLVCDNYVDVNMADTKANGASVTSNALSTAGGLIGYSFQKCRLTLDSAWEGTVNAQNSVGGLLYKLDGKLTVNSGFSVKDSAFTSGAGNRGILLGDGTDAFVVINCESSGFDGVKADGFDLFVGKNITATASNGVAAEGGLVTVETGASDIGKLPDATSGWYDLMNSHSNGNTRYYFNVAKLEKRAATKTVDSRADLIYWNVYDFIQNALPSYVMADSFPTEVYNIDGASVDVNLSGYCFYPTKKEGVTFDFSGHTLTFGVNSSQTAGQFKGLQSGIFSDITTGSGDITASFRNVVLAGTVQPVDGVSGAFVCGTVRGKSDTAGTAIARVTVSNVFLSGLTVAGTADYRPLLIHTIDSYSSCTVSDLSQYTIGTYKSAEKTNTYADGVKAASSLIGSGGVNSNGKLSEYVSVTFKDIVLAGEDSGSIFTKATLFDSIACTYNTSSLTYNFNLADDWTGNSTHIKAVTYGTELSTDPKQYEYHDQKLFVNPTDYPTQATGTNVHFTSGYMPYVRATDANSAVLRVNWKVVVFDGGWGTYEHPYELSKPEQLTFLSELVGGTVTGFDSGWNILYPKKDNNTLDYTRSEQYIADSSGALKNESGAELLSVTELLTYLRGAYYKITVATLTAEDGFIGIGNKENPFHGVIVGRSDTEKTVINMPNKSGIDSTGYGFINAANGCAVYGLDIRYNEVGLSNGSYSVATSRPFSASASTGVSHFGGVIAWVIGGDNVVDNVSVSVATLTAGHKTSVFGGYVGFVTGGGVTVRGLGDGVSNTLTRADSGYYYYNPYVGKMLCGYVLSDTENERYDNTGKNYDIPNITKKEAETQYTSKTGTFTLSDEADVYMLGFAINGGAFGYTEDTVSYGSKFGALSRNGNYAKVGVESQNDVPLTAGRYADDTTAGGETIFNSYFGVDKGVNLKSTDVDILFSGTDYNLSAYPNAFRGFGSPYNGGDCFKIRKVTGLAGENGSPATTITLNMDMKQYFQGGIYEADSVRNLALVPERIDPGNEFSNITISGKVALAVYNAANGSKLDYKIGTDNKFLFCQAGFVSYAESSKFSNVAIKGLVVESPGWAAGLVASENFSSKTNYKDVESTVDKCRIEGLNINGLQSSGAVYAYLRARNVALKDISITRSEIKTQASGLENAATDKYSASVGGLVGYTQNGKLTVEQSSVSDTAVLHLTKRSTNNNNADNGNAGGFVGTSSTALTLSGCTLDGCVVAAVLVNANDNVLASDYGETAGLTNTVYDKAQSMAAYLLDKNVPNINNGNAGGFVGRITSAVTMTSMKLSATGHSTVILGSDNAGGFVGVGTAAQTYTDLTAQTDGNPIYIIGKSRAAGVTAYGNNAVTAANITVRGSETAPVYILADGAEAPAAGLFADMQSGAFEDSSENAEISGCVIAGGRAAGALGADRDSGTVLLKNLKIFDNFIRGSNSAAGVLNTACISKSTTLDGLFLGNNVIRKSGNETNAGVIADTVYGGGATLTGYDLLLKGNDAGYGAAGTVKAILGSTASALKNTSGQNPEKVGLVAYENSGTVNILAISAEEANYPRIVKESSGEIKPVLVFAGYGAPTVFEEKYPNDRTYTPKQALADCGITLDGLTLSGDPVTSQGTQFTPDFLNEKTTEQSDRLWYNTGLHLAEGTGMKALSRLVSEGVTVKTDLPVLHITGKTDETMTAYLNLITNGGYGGMDRAFKILSATSDRYKLSDDGALTKLEGDTGSVGYDSSGKKFIAGKYDNLESADKTLSILTVTFADAAESHTYTMHAAVYYPRVLEYKSAIYALEGEVYQLSSFTESKIDIMAGSKFSFYMEYAYNSVAEKIENFNPDKYVFSHAMGDPNSPGAKFVKDTKMVLIDLNSDKAAGFQSYYYTVTDENGTNTVRLSDFMRDEKRFDEIDLLQVVENGLNGKIKDGTYSYVERYLMVVIPPKGMSGQFNLDAKADKNNQKNLTVIPYEQSCNISVWDPPKSESAFVADATSKTFSNTSDNVFQSELKVKQIFAKGYIAAMANRALYGTHVLKITKENDNTGVMLPAGTVVTLTRTLSDGSSQLLMSTRLAQAASSVRYSVGDILRGKNGTMTGTVYSDDIMISLDFSGASPLDFNRSFSDAGSYKLQDIFYLSGDTEHYSGGAETTCATDAATAKKAQPIKLALLAQNRKHLAINFGNLSEATDDGIIDFALATDISAVVADGVAVTDATVKFSVQKKVFEEGRYVYRELKNGDLPVVKALTGVDEEYTASLDVSDEKTETNDTFRLTVDVDTIRRSIEGNRQDYNFLTNYRLVAEVTVTGTKDEESVTHTAASYFTFLLCNIHSDMS